MPNQMAAATHTTIHVQAQPDHLEALTHAKPISALSELIWNALDASADTVRVVVNDNALGSPEEIFVIDNGDGIAFDEATQAFGNLGGSWKKTQRPHSLRKLHGRDGKGRFKAFSLGREVRWDTCYEEEKGSLKQYAIQGQIGHLQDFALAKPEKAKPNSQRGTTVRISKLSDDLGVLGADSSAVRRLAEVFAFFLRNYPSVRLEFRGERIEPSTVQKAITTIDLPPFTTTTGDFIIATLDIVEWSFAKKERRLYLCDEEGYTLHDVEASIRPGSEFNFTAYIRSPYISVLHEQNRLVDEIDEGVNHLIESARSQLRLHFRKRKAESASELVQQWKDAGIYPFSGAAINPLEQARREVFDICALNVHEQLESFRDGVTRDKKFTLRMIQTALDENPEALKTILNEVLDLPKDKQSELADLLQLTTLSALIEAGKLVTDRLKFLSGLEALLFGDSTKKTFKERSQLHKMLELETWIFGEEYFLSSSDEGLTTVLRKHMETLRPTGKKPRKAEGVSRDDGTSAVIDMLLGREIPAYAKTKREFLVVELKRPNQKIDMAVKNQIESYAVTVSADERFDKHNTTWHFLALSNDITPEAERTIQQVGKPTGICMMLPNLTVGLATWSSVINASRARLEVFRTKLDYTATYDQGIASLRAKHQKYLPDNL